jgi:hypothetical protein
MVDEEKKRPAQEDERDEQAEQGQEFEDTADVDADQAPLEVASLDQDKTEEPEVPSPNDEQTRMDFLVEEAREEKYNQLVEHLTAEEDVQEAFEERQEYDREGEQELEEKLSQYHSKSPEISGGDVDAAWEDADQSGEEAVGGSTPTPDQDIVEELGQAMGIQYEDDEPLDTEGKLRQRDRDRWELDPESAEETEEEEEE